MKLCALCRNGEIKQEADFKVKGFKYLNNDKKIPYHSYLCEDHLNIMLEDGAKLEIIEYLSDNAKYKRILELLHAYTGYKTITEFLYSNPTIRKNSFKGANYLREYYKEKIGRYPIN